MPCSAAAGRMSAQLLALSVASGTLPLPVKARQSRATARACPAFRRPRWRLSREPCRTSARTSARSKKPGHSVLFGSYVTHDSDYLASTVGRPARTVGTKLRIGGSRDAPRGAADLHDKVSEITDRLCSRPIRRRRSRTRRAPQRTREAPYAAAGTWVGRADPSCMACRGRDQHRGPGCSVPPLPITSTTSASEAEQRPARLVNAARSRGLHRRARWVVVRGPAAGLYPHVDALGGTPFLLGGQVGSTRTSAGVGREMSSARGHNLARHTSAASAEYSSTWLTRYSRVKLPTTVAKLP